MHRFGIDLLLIMTIIFKAVSENSQFVRDLGFNSMQMLCMAVMTEESFGCRIDADCYKNIKTVGDIITLICGMQCRTNRTLP